MYVVVGANGFLGAYIIKSVLENTKEDVLAVSRNLDKVNNYGTRVKWFKCDITQREDVLLLEEEISKSKKMCNIIYLAAYHHPDMVAKNPKIAWDTNITSLASFLNIIDNVRCFFYPSTDSVYGEGDENYHFKESDSLNPVNRYGRQKATAECLVNAYGYNVVRYPFIIAPSLLLHKKHFHDKILETIKNGEKMEMFSDSLRSSLDFGTAADLLVRLIENYSAEIPPVLNLSGDDDLSKYDIGVMVAQKYDLPVDLIVPISSEKAEGIFEAKRAKSTLLDNSLLKKTLGISEIKIKL